MLSNQPIALELREVAPSHLIASVSIQTDFINTLYRSIVNHHQQTISTPGFLPGSITHDYIERNYKNSIMTGMQDYLLSFVVSSWLSETLAQKPITIVGRPRLIDIQVNCNAPALFSFEITTTPITITNSWKNSNFRAPVRKNYRDLDNQVTMFLQEEYQRTQALLSDTVEINDWICFSLTPYMRNDKPLLEDRRVKLWMRISSEEPDSEAQQLFLGKRIHDRFLTQARFLQDYFHAIHEQQYEFSVAIEHHTQHMRFCIETFKRHFKIKTSKDLHRKLIEVFSFRNDISQRRETVEAALRLLLKQHPISLPTHFIAEAEAELFHSMHANPDFYVYRAQHDFEEKIKILAQKQLKEATFVDALSHAEHVNVTDQDILGYLNLLKRPRTKEFLYFRLPESQVNECEVPIAHETLYRTCLREKTLNHAITILTRT